MIQFGYTEGRNTVSEHRDKSTPAFTIPYGCLPLNTNEKSVGQPLSLKCKLSVHGLIQFPFPGAESSLLDVQIPTKKWQIFP